MAAPTECPSCGSGFLQPLRCEPSPGSPGQVTVDLRCPECSAWLRDTLTRAEARELDRRQARLRGELVQAYELAVRESLEALADCFGTALRLDLLGADDFR